MNKANKANKANEPQYIFVSYSLPGDGIFSTGMLLLLLLNNDRTFQ